MTFVVEMETLLHEVWPAVRDAPRTRHVGQAGASVMLDFVEAPSQMLEDWVFDAQVLKLMQEVCTSCAPVPRPTCWPRPGRAPLW